MRGLVTKRLQRRRTPVVLLAIVVAAFTGFAGTHSHAASSPGAEPTVSASTGCVACALSHVPVLSSLACVGVAPAGPVNEPVLEPNDESCPYEFVGNRHGRAPPAR